MTQAPSGPRAASSRGAIAWRAVTLGCAVAIALCVGGGLWVGLRASLATNELRQAADAVGGVIQSPEADLGLAIDAAGEHARAASVLMGDPVWTITEGVPWIGAHLRAIRGVGAVAVGLTDAASRDAMTDLLTALRSGALAPVDGQFDADAVDGASEAARALATKLAAAALLIPQDSGTLVPSVGEALGDGAQILRDASSALVAGADLVPQMLGVEGSRTYLLLFTTNAEWRSRSGVVGATALIRAQDGRLSLTAQAAGAAFPPYDEPVIELDDDFRALFGTRPARWIQNVTQFPDFAVGARAAAEMWELRFGEAVDGVVLIDPVSVSYLLAATGPLVLGDGETLSADNAVALLLHDVYVRLPVDRQDAFFADAARRIFDAVASGAADPALLVRALDRSASEHRLAIWSADPDEQTLVAATSVAGGLPRSDATTSRIGVYLNDGTGSKIDYFVRASAQTRWCADEAGRSTLVLRIEIANQAPQNSSSLPAYVTGGGAFGVPEGHARTIAYVYLPPAFTLVDADRPVGSGTDAERSVVRWPSEVEPGASDSVVLTLRGPHTPQAAVELTPVIEPAPADPLVCPPVASVGSLRTATPQKGTER